MQNITFHIDFTFLAIRLCTNKEQNNMYLYFIKVLSYKSYIQNNLENGLALKGSAIDAKYYFLAPK